MSIFALILIAVIAALHLYIAWFEMFAWESKGPKIFSSLPATLFGPTKAMAGNQGLYNAFLAAGLIWSILITDPDWSRAIATFFLLCVGIAGVYGAATVSRRIVYVQTVPALLALAALYVF